MPSGIDNLSMSLCKFQVNLYQIRLLSESKKYLLEYEAYFKPTSFLVYH